MKNINKKVFFLLCHLVVKVNNEELFLIAAKEFLRSKKFELDNQRQEKDATFCGHCKLSTAVDLLTFKGISLTTTFKNNAAILGIDIQSIPLPLVFCSL